MIGYIYKTTNLLNKKIYVGQKQGNFSPEYYGSGFLITKALDKYGKNNFSIKVIAYAKNKKKLDLLEKLYIKKYREIFGKNKLYNISKGGTGGRIWTTPPSLGMKFPYKPRPSISGSNNPMYGISQKGELNPMFGKKHSEKTKKLIFQKVKANPNFGKWNKGLVRSEDFRKRESETKKRLFAEGKLKSWNEGRHWSLAVRKKLSKSRKRWLKLQLVNSL